ncbi:MAG: hypothetical protein SGPRY_014348 [Prymnesium sp.]
MTRLNTLGFRERVPLTARSLFASVGGSRLHCGTRLDVGGQGARNQARWPLAVRMTRGSGEGFIARGG